MNGNSRPRSSIHIDLVLFSISESRKRLRFKIISNKYTSTFDDAIVPSLPFYSLIHTTLKGCLAQCYFKCPFLSVVLTKKIYEKKFNC